LPNGHAAPGHHPALQHHFDTLEQQQDASTFGMWLFLATEVMFFGGLFMAYTLYRFWYPDAWAAASHHLNITLGGFNTAVLLGSSLTMALAVRAAQLGRRNSQVIFLLLTIVLGVAFLGVKVVEYADKFEHHLVPGPNFLFEDPRYASGAQIFFSVYFAMTGMHAVHMVIGVGLLAWLTVNALRYRYTAEWNTPVELVGLYWHFVDIVWIFLFPLLYLVGHH
jgi:cytochrome c oxidase subunit III